MQFICFTDKCAQCMRVYTPLRGSHAGSPKNDGAPNKEVLIQNQKMK